MQEKTEVEKISPYYQKDHYEIDAILKRTDFNVLKNALPIFEEFVRRLERHILWEENLLFPKVTQKEPMLGAGPIRVMREEHKEIRRLRDQALEALKAGNGQKARSAAEQMKTILVEHNSKEEAILYPACDRFLNAQERASLFDEMHKLGA